MGWSSSGAQRVMIRFDRHFVLMILSSLEPLGHSPPNLFKSLSIWDKNLSRKKECNWSVSSSRDWRKSRRVKMRVLTVEGGLILVWWHRKRKTRKEKTTLLMAKMDWKAAVVGVSSMAKTLRNQLTAKKGSRVTPALNDPTVGFKRMSRASSSSSSSLRNDDALRFRWKKHRWTSSINTVLV